MSNDDNPTPEPDSPPDAGPSPTPGTPPEPSPAPTPPPGYEVPSAPTQPYGAPGYASASDPPPGQPGPQYSQHPGYPAPQYPGGAYPPGGGTPPQYPQSPYSPGPYPGQPQGGRTDGVSIAALVTGLLGLGIVPLVLGIIGLGRTKQRGTEGRGLAIAGIILGALAIVAGIVLTVAIVVGVTTYNNRMDDLRSDCAAGDLAACDDLYRDAWPGSDEREFGDTCGGRTDGGSSCAGLDATTHGTYGDDADLDVLWDACAAGDGTACDDLYWRAPIGSEYEQFATTCGNRVDFAARCTEVTD